MNKAEYIEKYGEDAWAIRRAKKNAWQRERRKNNPDYDREWRKEHPYSPKRKYNKDYYVEKYGEDGWEERLKKYRRPRKDEYIAKYGKEAWEKLLASTRKWKSENKEKHIESVTQWKKDNMDKVREYRKKYKKEHKDLVNAQAKERRGRKVGRAYSLLYSYKQSDNLENRGECTLTKDWIIDNIFNSSCVYCGDSDWRHLGCDRIDNSLPHTPENCVCACGICNIERSDRYTIAEFKEYRKTHPRECDKIKSDTPLVDYTE